MQVNLNKLINKNDVVAVATSGGSDSMALLHYLHKKSKQLQIKVIALNVEHGIRGQSSISDSNFVKEYCQKNHIPCLCYVVDSVAKSKQEKISIEQSARLLRYDCFYDALNNKQCTKVATAHHAKDNLESVLFNLFRGTGYNGLSGIKQNIGGQIIRPFLTIKKEQIEQYVQKNNIPFVVDETNDQDKYTRNFIRLNILPKIEQIFPEAQKSVSRFCEIANEESDFLDQQASNCLIFEKEQAQIILPLHKALFSRAVIKALQYLGVNKDWSKTHVDACWALVDGKNSSSVDLLNGVVAVREYDKITFYRKSQTPELDIPFSVQKIQLPGRVITFERVDNPNLKKGLFFDHEKIPLDARLRYKKDGDKFTKFGGGTKDLNDYLCDKKIALRLRETIPVLASGNKVLLIVGVAISNDIKVDDTTKNIIKITEEKHYGKQH